MQHPMLQDSVRAKDKFLNEPVVLWVKYVYREKVTVQSKAFQLIQYCIRIRFGSADDLVVLFSYPSHETCPNTKMGTSLAYL